MAVFPGTVWRGNCANTDGPRNATVQGVVLHVNDGPNVSLWDWVNKASSRMSCHFQILQNGLTEQYLDTDEISWCQMAGNYGWLSIEMPTHPDVGMTAQQITAGGRVLAWAAKLYGFPLQLTNDVNGKGFGWHGMGGADWGGHFGCPGTIRRGQMAQLLDAARGGSIPTSDWFDMASAADLKTALRDVLNEGQAIGSLGWASTNQTLAGNVQTLLNKADLTNSLIDNNPKGMLFRMAALQAAFDALPAAIAAEIAKQAPGSTVDVNAIAAAVITQLGTKLS